MIWGYHYFRKHPYETNSLKTRGLVIFGTVVRMIYKFTNGNNSPHKKDGCTKFSLIVSQTCTFGKLMSKGNGTWLRGYLLQVFPTYARFVAFYRYVAFFNPYIRTYMHTYIYIYSIRMYTHRYIHMRQSWF